MDRMVRAVHGFQPVAMEVLGQREHQSGTLHRIGRPSAAASKTLNALHRRDARYRALAERTPNFREKVAGERVKVIYDKLPDDVYAYHVARHPDDKGPLIVVLNKAFIANIDLEHEAILHEVLEEATIRRGFSAEEAHRIAWVQAPQWYPSIVRPSSGLTGLQEAELRRSAPQQLMAFLAEKRDQPLANHILMERANSGRKERKPIKPGIPAFQENRFRGWAAYYLLEPEKARQGFEIPGVYDAVLNHLPVLNDMLRSNALGLEAIRAVWRENPNALIQAFRTIEAHRQVFDELCSMLGPEAVRIGFINSPTHFGTPFATFAAHMGTLRNLFKSESVGAPSLWHLLQSDTDVFWLLVTEMIASPKLFKDLSSQGFLTIDWVRDALNENPKGLAHALLFLLEDEQSYERFSRAFGIISRSNLGWTTYRNAFVHSPLLFVQTLANWGENARFITPYLNYSHVNVAKLSRDLKVPIEFHVTEKNKKTVRAAQHIDDRLEPRVSNDSLSIVQDGEQLGHAEALRIEFSEELGFGVSKGKQLFPTSLSEYDDLQLAKRATLEDKAERCLPRDRKIIVGWDLAPSEITLLTNYYVKAFAALPPDQRPLLILAVAATDKKRGAMLRTLGLRVATRGVRIQTGSHQTYWLSNSETEFSDLDVGFWVSKGRALLDIPEIADLVVTGSNENLKPFLGRNILYFRDSDRRDARLVNRLIASKAAMPVNYAQGQEQLKELSSDLAFIRTSTALKGLQGDGTLCAELQIAYGLWSSTPNSSTYSREWAAPSGAFVFDAFLKRVLARQSPPETEHIIEPSEQVWRFLTAYGLLKHNGSLEFDPELFPTTLMRQSLINLFGSYDVDVTEFLQIFTGTTMETIGLWRKQALAAIEDSKRIPWWAQLGEMSLLHNGEAVLQRLRDRYLEWRSSLDVETGDRLLDLLAQLMEVVEHSISLIEGRAMSGQTSLQSVIESVQQKPYIRSKNVHIRLELPDGPGDIVPLSRAAVYAIVYNIAYNTASYARADSKELVIRYSKTSGTLVLEDNGGGFQDLSLLVPNEVGMQKVFELGRSSGDKTEGHYGIGSFHVYLISVANGLNVKADNGDNGARYAFQFPPSPPAATLSRSVRSQA